MRNIILSAIIYINGLIQIEKLIEVFVSATELHSATEIIQIDIKSFSSKKETQFNGQNLIYNSCLR